MLKSLLCVMFAVFTVQAIAAGQDAPDALVHGVMNEVLDSVKNDKAIQAGDQKKIIDLLETKVVRYFDFPHMTALAMGRDWRNASADQRSKMAAEFQSLLIRTYSNALTQYKGQTIDFKPLRMQPADTDVTVHTEVKQAGSKSITIDYEMEKKADGWKVYDVVVAGVSLVTNYRDEFSQQIKANGIDGLIKSLHEKNATLESTKK
jgi:phospholipid transport system substrate-binding protein